MKGLPKTFARLVFFLCCLAVVSHLAHAKYPAVLRTERDIEVTPADWYAISIAELPIALYPKLLKFSDVEHIFYVGKKGGASDVKLKALSALNLPKLRQIGVGGSLSVTTEGVMALSKFPSLQGLQLSRTAITDELIEGLKDFPHLASINIVDCSGITFAGLQKIVGIRDWEGISFSAEKLSTEQVIKILEQLSNKAYCMVVDKSMHLDESMLRRVSTERGVSLDLRKDPIFPGYK